MVSTNITDIIVVEMYLSSFLVLGTCSTTSPRDLTGGKTTRINWMRIIYFQLRKTWKVLIPSLSSLKSNSLFMYSGLGNFENWNRNSSTISIESSDSLFNTEFASWTIISSKSGSWLKYSKLDAMCHRHRSSNRPILNKRAWIDMNNYNNSRI